MKKEREKIRKRVMSNRLNRESRHLQSWRKPQYTAQHEGKKVGKSPFQEGGGGEWYMYRGHEPGSIVPEEKILNNSV